MNDMRRPFVLPCVTDDGPAVLLDVRCVLTPVEVRELCHQLLACVGPNPVPAADVDPLVLHVAEIAADLASLDLGRNAKQDRAYAFLRSLSHVFTTVRAAIDNASDPTWPLRALRDALADADTYLHQG